MSILEVPDPFSVELSAAYLIGLGNAPFVAGDDIRLRLQAKRAGVAQDLSLASIWWTMRDKESGSSSFTRKTGVALGTSYQIVVDSQASEDVAAGTGTGWLTVQFANTDQTSLLPFCGLLRPWDLRIQLATGEEIETYGRGRIEWLRPRTLSTV